MQSHESSAINNNEGTPVPTTTMTTTADAAALLAEIASLKSQLVQLQSSEHLAQSRLERIERAVGPFIPKQFVELLGRTDFTELELGDHKERKLTILFLDIRNFTRMSEDLPPAGVFDLVNAFLGALEPEIEKARGFVDKYVGDSIMALFPGSPGSPAGAEDAIAGAEAMLVALDKFNQDRVQKGLQEVKVGIGLNTGPAIVGTVGGLDRMETTVLSDAVNLASRLESATKVYGVPLLISEATLYALGKPPGPTTRYLDRIRVKGKLQPQSIYEVFSKDPKELREAKTATRSKFEEGVALYHMKQVDRALLLFQECLRVAPDDRPAQVYLERCHVFKREGKHETTGELEGTVEWRREFDLGVDAIDEQHRELLSRMNLLAPCLEQGNPATITSTLDFLEYYAREHFGLEFRLMSKHSYPFLHEHMREHRSFVEHFTRIRIEIESGRHDQNKSFLVFLVQIFLIDWFANHSTGTDRHLARYLKRLWGGRGVSPSEEKREMVQGGADGNGDGSGEGKEEKKEGGEKRGDSAVVVGS